MERVFRLKLSLACVYEAGDLPKGTLAMEPRCVGRDAHGEADYVFLASTDGGRTWREYRTVIEDASDRFEIVAGDAMATGWP